MVSSKRLEQPTSTTSLLWASKSSLSDSNSKTSTSFPHCQRLHPESFARTGYPLSPTEPYLSVGSLQPTMLAYLVGPMATARCTVRVSAIHEEYRVGARWWG